MRYGARGAPANTAGGVVGTVGSIIYGVDKW